MSRNAVYTGCLMGVAVVAALFYPLYAVVPGLYVSGWQAGSKDLGLFLALVAAIVLIIGGALAARRGGAGTRFKGAKLGALAGGIAGTMTFAALGAAAAGTIGLGNILLPGTPPIDNQPFLILQTQAIVQTANFTYAAFWGMLLGGALLGALGGILALPSAGKVEKRDESALRIAEVISMRLLLVSLLILVVSVATTPILLRSENASQQPAMISLFNWSVGSGFAVYLAILLWILRLARNKLAQNAAPFRKRQVKDQLYMASVLSMLALIAMVISLLSDSLAAQEVEPRLLLNPVFLIGSLTSLALSGYLLKLARGLSRQQYPADEAMRAAVPQPQEEMRNFVKKENLPLFAWISGTAFALPPLTLVPLVINLTRGVVPTITMLINLEGAFDPTRSADGTAVSIVQDVFMSQALVAYGAFLFGAVSILFSISFALGISRLRKRAA